MNRWKSFLFLGGLGALALACGGVSGSSTDGGVSAAQAPLPFGGVQYQTYEDAKKKRVQFLDDHRAKITWRNMDGAPVMAEYTQVGERVEIDWGDTDASGTRHSVMKQLDACQLVLTSLVDKDGVTTDITKMYVKQDDRCRSR